MNMNDKGLSLVEVLAAVVILGILFIGIMSIFPQMTLFNAKTETKLDTMNLARQEMAEIVKASKWEKILVTSPTDPTSLEPQFLDKEKIKNQLQASGYNEDIANSAAATPYTANSFVRYTKEGEYRYVVDMYLQCEPFLLKDPVASGAGTKVPCAEGDRIKLYKVHLRVFSNKSSTTGSYQMSSETYSYIRYTAKKPGG
ncbi:type II secretion system protein [Planococcus sp. CPCC 101016]|uniref:type IV pilus modification PilV family protein n=1 Tax=Planococcus sp. CPCC 101016 TaxID=2599617 RepID=UPI0011B67342|nr:type II secretion system protein [Planococcus sp. CPCC 101016]TWT08347.1 type II secretion system protein [Planococcus sp. CPCC 101016]